MNYILLNADDISKDGKTVILKDRRLEHIRQIIKPVLGDSLRVGLRDGKLGAGRVADLQAKALVLDDLLLEKNPPAKLPLTLILALPRPPVLKRILLHGTAVGVPKIYLIQTNRVEKSYWQSPALKEGNMEEQLILGLEQGGDTVLPEIFLKKRFKPFVEDELPLLSQNSMKLLAHPDEAEKCPYQVNKPITLFIGPEGGFVPFEVDLLEKNGFRAVTIGSRPWRVEAIVFGLIARLF